ncbi:BolA family transcriptional regulator [Noviherbaspirillum cavernae]|uniref:BolA family transcriptional regulator n=1 Tax=Noviherbaspirillum cavernae TaxID=2320862 RepID=A0A418X0S7_9BURK|nr:BolA family protein [Noviherbaspirillum cavernae]RJG06041.1 BolA family transcriptional regulator [Noviherbaspirillum cavernae]
MTDRLERIRARLIATFAPLECQLEDESHLHVGHAGAESGAGHYRLHIVSTRFEGLNRIGRHRLVYDCLHDMMHTDIHALAIIAMAPSEVSR